MKNTIEVANILLINQSLEILLLLRAPNLKSPLLWGLPGGLVDFGENPEHAALRELDEETKISRQHIVIDGLKKFSVNMPDENIIMYTILATLTEEVDIKLDTREHIQYKWIQRNFVYESSNLIPCLPTIIAYILSPDLTINDRTISEGVSVEMLDN